MKDWPTARLGDLCVITAGGTPSRSNPAHFSGKIPWVKIGDMLQGRVVSTEESITDLALRSSPAKLLPAGTVIISIFATIGRTAVLGVDAATNQAIAGVAPRDPKKLSPLYLRRYLDSVVSTLERKARGAAQVNINLTILKSLPIPVPSQAEQTKVLEVLDRADELRAKRREALAHLDALTQSIFLDMFGDPTLNPLGLPRMQLGELIALGPQNGLYKPSSVYGQGTPIVRIDAFYEGVITGLAKLKRLTIDQAEIDRYGLAERDILINRVNSLDYLGKSAVVPRLEEPTVFESNMMRLRLDPSRVDAKFIIQLLQSGYIKSQIRAAAKNAVNQSSINQKDVQTLEVIVPPLAAQQEFVRRADAVQQHTRRLRASLAELDALFAALQDRAFRGLL